VVNRRGLEVYRIETAPLADDSAERGLVVRVAGNGAVEKVTERLLAALNAG